MPKGDRMAVNCSVLDVAAYILKKAGSMSTMKLQKLVYYSQAWSLVWDERPLFKEKICAWANGPVAPKLFDAHRGLYRVQAGDIGGDTKHLDTVARETVNAILKTYGDKTPQWLSDLTHLEAPWRQARAGITEGEHGNAEITHSMMYNYYSTL
jgi:uncharacterized phage-associated protein